MGEAFVPKFEYRPELEPSLEGQPRDRLTELMIILYEGKREVVAADFSGLEQDLQDLVKARGGDFRMVAKAAERGTSISWGSNYAEQRVNLETILEPGEVTDLERWGAELLTKRGRGIKRDRRTHVRGVVIPQVFLDFYRFVCSDQWPHIAKMNANKLAEKVNGRMRNWRGGGGEVKNPSPCSGEMMALVLHYVRTGEKADWYTPGVSS